MVESVPCSCAGAAASAPAHAAASTVSGSTVVSRRRRSLAPGRVERERLLWMLVECDMSILLSFDVCCLVCGFNVRMRTTADIGNRHPYLPYKLPNCPEPAPSV